MCSWKKQATPLIFITVCMEQVAPGISDERFQEYYTRLKENIEKCWEFVKQDGELDKYIKKTKSTHRDIEVFLTEHWRKSGNKYSELMAAMLDIVERVSVTHPLKTESRKAWDELAITLSEMYELADPLWKKELEQLGGIAISDKICDLIGIR